VYQLSGSADLVKTYLVELPASWRNTECTAHLAATAEGRLDAADLRVSGNDPLWEEAPHARQYGGCGVRGSGVDLPFAVLTDGVDMEAARLNASLLELVRWRYGVFAEVGFAGDLMFPAVSTLGERMLENAGCDDMEGGLCPLTAAYRGDAATKQNLLCRERSARRTILDQFAGGQLAAAPQHFSKPNLTYLLPADTERLVLVLEQSERMEAHWRAVLASTFHFINSLEEGTELAVVVFSQAATVQLEPTRVVGGNREGLHYRIPRRLPPSGGNSGGSSCLECGLAAAVQLATNTTTLVLLTSAGASANLSNYPSSGGPTLRHIVLGQNSATVSSAGSSYLVESGGDSFPDTASRVSSALASSVHIHPGRKFHQER